MGDEIGSVEEYGGKLKLRNLFRTIFRFVNMRAATTVLNKRPKRRRRSAPAGGPSFDVDFIIADVLPFLTILDAINAMRVSKTWHGVIKSSERYWKKQNDMMEKKKESLFGDYGCFRFAAQSVMIATLDCKKTSALNLLFEMRNTQFFDSIVACFLNFRWGDVQLIHKSDLQYIECPPDLVLMGRFMIEVKNFLSRAPFQNGFFTHQILFGLSGRIGFGVPRCFVRNMQSKENGNWVEVKLEDFLRPFKERVFGP